MADAAPPIVPAEPDDSARLSPAELEKKQRKKAQKARAVWISFAGRIIAQILGAAASVALGIMVLQRYQAGPSGGTPVAGAPAAVITPAAAPARAALPRQPGEAAIAVLPLENLSGDAAQEYFADGMTEALVAALAQIDGLKVISRTSTMRYKTEHPSVPEIARTLGVDLVVEGSVLQADGQVRVTTQLIDGATDEHLWARSYTRRLEDVIALQDEVAATIGTEIMGTVTRRPGMRAAPARTVDPAVYDLYLRGRHAWNQRTPEGLKTAIDYFSRAVAQDGSFALAHVGLADAHAVQGSPGTGLLDVRAPMALARQSARRALDLDPSLAEAHTALGGVLFFGDRDFPGAEAELRQAIAINPNYPVAHEWLSVLLAELGRDREAMVHAEKAVTLSPLEAVVHQAQGLVHYYARRYDDAVRSVRRALQLTPSLPLARSLQVKALTLGGHAADAVAVCEADEVPREDRDLMVACGVAASRAGHGAEAAQWRARIEASRPAPGVALAQMEAALGEYPSAFARLERLGARGNLPPALMFDPLFDGLRRQPQWPAIAALLAPR